jgi:phosphinothricin acetyltransferase
MAGGIRIRDASVEDSEAIAAIYAHHVLNGTASYDTEPPPSDAHRDKIARITSAGWPFLVAVTDDGGIAAYAYAMQFRDRAAYRFTCENSIYVNHAHVGRGIGRKLLAALVDSARDCGFRQMIAVIGGAEPASVAIHRHCGFVEAGRLRHVGFKHDRWLDTVYMQRALAD